MLLDPEKYAPGHPYFSKSFASSFSLHEVITKHIKKWKKICIKFLSKYFYMQEFKFQGAAMLFISIITFKAASVTNCEFINFS